MGRYNEDVIACLNCGKSFTFEPEENVKQEIECYYCGAIHSYERNVSVRLKRMKTVLMKVVYLKNSYERNIAIRDFEKEKGSPATIYMNRKTFCSIHGYFEPEYDDEDQWIDGQHYLIADRFIYGAEVILDDDVMILI